MSSTLASTRSRRLPARYAAWLLPLIVSVIMSCVISGIATLKNAGLAPDTLARWMSAWGVSWLVAFPTLLVVLPLARGIVGRLVQAPGR
jgi:hypothetical protein